MNIRYPIYEGVYRILTSKLIISKDSQGNRKIRGKSFRELIFFSINDDNKATKVKSRAEMIGPVQNTT